MALPVNIDATYPERSAGDAAHQQHHDAIHAAVNEVTDGRLTEAALSATLVSRTASPRDTQRATYERKPVLSIEQELPNRTWGETRLVHAKDDTFYTVGNDRTLRKSTDAGVTWKKLANSGSNIMARFGLFFKTQAGTILTTYHPDNDSVYGQIQRSTDDGATFSQVVASQTYVEYLGPTAICQDEVTGYLYLVEYTTASAANLPQFRIKRSTDDGATWSVFKAFDRDATAYPTTAIRHGHAAQWDQHGQRVYFLLGDGEDAAGIYRVNAAGTDVEPVLRKGDSTYEHAATAVGVMFFPDYIAWGQDGTTDAFVLRMARDQIGLPDPVIEETMHIQSASWYTVRTKADGSEWLMCASNQAGGVVDQLDHMIHAYRVADNGATVDEVAAFSAPQTTQTGYFWPIGTPLQNNADGHVWIHLNVRNPYESTGIGGPRLGQQFKVRLGWGTESVPRGDQARVPWVGTPLTFNSGNCALAAGETRPFAAFRVPNHTRRLFLFELGTWKLSGSGSVEVRVRNASAGGLITDAASGSEMKTTTHGILYNTAYNESAPNVGVSAKIPSGYMIYLDLVETSGTATATAVAHAQVAFGY